MTDTQLGELRRCAREARRLLNGSDTAARNTRALALATGVLVHAAGLPEQETDPAEGTIQNPDESLWSLAQAITTLRANSDELSAIDEAVAALLLLSSILSESAPPMPARIHRLRELGTGSVARIRTVRNGPYIVTNAATLSDWLVQPLIVPPTVALCRCGASAIKPFCDGTHVQKAFDDRKDPNRVPDRQDTYVGQQLTTLDNRGTCAHSGFCTDRLATVFHQGKEPFVTPSGARSDEIVQAIRACPSGALSVAVDGREAREQVDTVRSPAIEVSRDGPYRITGGIPLVDDDGAAVARNSGASLEHYSLCRCGQSQNKPFCSGMPWHV